MPTGGGRPKANASATDNVEATAGIPDADFLSITSYQEPRRFRVSARWAF